MMSNNSKIQKIIECKIEIRKEIWECKALDQITKNSLMYNINNEISRLEYLIK